MCHHIDASPSLHSRHFLVRGCVCLCVSHIRVDVCARRLCETVVPLEDPIITETTSALQEWGVLWKQLYVVSNTGTQHISLT